MMAARLTGAVTRAAEVTSKADLVAYAAARKYGKETGGIVVDGMAVATDDRSKMMLLGARVAAQNDAEFSTAWKMADGTWQTVSAAAIIAISDAVLAHVDGCFQTEKSVDAAIEAGTVTTTAEIDALFAA